MLDDDFAFHLIEYDNHGAPIRQSLETVPLVSDAGLVDSLTASEEELKLLGASPTGAKSVPDNTDSWGVLFRMKAVSDDPPTRRWLPVWEVESPWRRGRGWAFWNEKEHEVRIWGIWVPWRRPKKPKVEVFIDHESMNVSPGQLLGPPPEA